MRLTLAISGLLIIYIDPTEPSRFVALTYSTLSLYSVYSALLCASALRRGAIDRVVQPWAHWLDIAWYSVLITLTSGTNSIFFFGFFFSIMVASFRWGFLSGMRVTIISAFLFTGLGLATVTGDAEFHVNRFLLRPIFLLVLGYILACQGEFEILFRRRLALLKDVSALSNPRFGIERTIGSLIERLRAFYSAQYCLLLIAEATGDGHRVYRASHRDPERAMRAEELPMGLLRTLLSLPSELAATFSSGIVPVGRIGGHFYGCDVLSGQRVTYRLEQCEAIAATLDARSLATVPLLHREQIVGRLYLTANRWGVFHDSDIDFLLQIVEHALPAMENIRLVDRLATDASEQERRRIARDLHDSVIQPYIGIQLGLAALRQANVIRGAGLADEIDHLIGIATQGIQDLRDHVLRLNERGEAEKSLPAAVRRFATRLTEATGIQVEVEGRITTHVNDRLAAEAFQIIAEGLSNVRRHTSARRATVTLGSSSGNLVLRIENERENGFGPEPFRPRSISERAKALGGNAQVLLHEANKTVVLVEIPL